MNAFINQEISFPTEKFIVYLKNLAAKRLTGNEGTIIQYHHNFNNVTLSQRGPNSLHMGLGRLPDKSDKSFSSIS